MCIDHDVWLSSCTFTTPTKTERLHCSPWLVACCRTSKKPQGPSVSSEKTRMVSIFFAFFLGDDLKDAYSSIMSKPNWWSASLTKLGDPEDVHGFKYPWFAWASTPSAIKPAPWWSRSKLGIHRDHEEIDYSNQAGSDKPHPSASPGGDHQGFPCVLAMQYGRAKSPATGILLNPHISWTTWIISLKMGHIHWNIPFLFVSLAKAKWIRTFNKKKTTSFNIIQGMSISGHLASQ